MSIFKMSLAKIFGGACIAIGIVGGLTVKQNADYFLKVSARANAAFAVKPLLTFGATAQPEYFSEDPLWLASLHGSTKTGEKLLDEGFDVNSWKSVALITAAGKGHLDMVRLLVSRGAHINARGPRGALTSAAAAGQLEVVKFLLDSGVNLKANEGMAVNRARLLGRHEIARYIERSEKNKNRQPVLP